MATISQHDSQGGIVPSDLDRARNVDLITLPEDVDGTNCSNCKFIQDGFCTHPQVQLHVNERMCCALWDRQHALRAWEQGSKALPEQAGPGPAPPTLAIDLDGTLAEVHPDWPHVPVADLVPRDGAAETVQELQRHGYRIIIWTVHDDYEAVAAWLAAHGIPFDFINHNPDNPTASPKIEANYYIDDKAISAIQDWDDILDAVLDSGQTEPAVKHTIVTGYSGAGKSTLAKSLSERTGLPVHKVDQDPKWRENKDLADDPQRYELGTKAAKKYRKLLKGLVRRALALPEPHILEGCQFLVCTGTLRGHDVVLIDADPETIVRQRLTRDAADGKLQRDGEEARRQKALDLYYKLQPDIERLKTRLGVQVITPEQMQEWLEQYGKDRLADTRQSITTIRSKSTLAATANRSPKNFTKDLLFGKLQLAADQFTADCKALSAMSETSGAALTAPPQQGNRKLARKCVRCRTGLKELPEGWQCPNPSCSWSLYQGGDPDQLRQLRAKYRDKDLFSSIENTARYLAGKWEMLEARYGRRAGLGMAVAMLATSPLPGSIPAIVAAAEAMRGLHGYLRAHKSVLLSLQ